MVKGGDSSSVITCGSVCAPLPHNLHQCPYPHLLEEFDHVAVAHADAAVGERFAHRLVFSGSVDVDVAPHAVELASAIEAGFFAAEPQDAREYPVAFGMGRREFGRPDFSGRSAATKNRAERSASPDPRPDAVAAARRTAASIDLPHAIDGRGNGIAADAHAISRKKFEFLAGDVDPDAHGSGQQRAGAPRGEKGG